MHWKVPGAHTVGMTRLQRGPSVRVFCKKPETQPITHSPIILWAYIIKNNRKFYKNLSGCKYKPLRKLSWGNEHVNEKFVNT